KHDLVSADDIHNVRQVVLLRVDRDRALPVEVLARLLSGLRNHPPDLLVVSIHAGKPIREPAAPGLKEDDLEPWKALQDSAGQEAQTGQLLLEWVRDDVLEEEVLEAVGTGGRHRLGKGSFVEADRHAQLFGACPERIVDWIRPRTAAVWIGPHVDDLE